MRFGFSEEQQMLADTARRLISRQFPADRVRQFTEKVDLDRKWTGALAEAGLFGVCCPDRFGGLDMGAVDALTLAIEAGRSILPYPLAESIVAAHILGAADDERAAAIVGGELVPAICWSSAVSLRTSGKGKVAEGALGLVAWADSCDMLLVPVEGRKAMLVVDPTASGVTIEKASAFDKTATVGRVSLSGYRVDPSKVVEGSVATAEALATVLASGDLLGAARASFELTVDYVKQREQFGQPIGRYQAIKHILADDALLLESAEVAILYAAWAHDAQTEDREVAVHVAKAYASDGAHKVVEDSVQCHGGIGFTWEYGLHFKMRRIARMARTLGSASDHRSAIAEHLINKAQDRARQAA